MGSARTLAHTTTPLAAAGLNSVFLSDVFDAASLTIQKPFLGLNLLKGFVNGDQNVTIDIYQAPDLATINAVDKTTPAAGVNDGFMFHQQLDFVGGVAGDGSQILFPLVGPFIRIRATNTSGVDMTKFALHVEATE